VIDEDLDGMNNPMKLYRTKTKDELLNDYIYFLNVVDPSTEREYYLCVPECKNVWAAKSFTFNNKKIEIRHGDVALLNLKKEFEKPIFES
jgi:predicted  nucleic acid-binding Zn ribbon protein